jgi:hypothetical protein
MIAAEGQTELRYYSSDGGFHWVIRFRLSHGSCEFEKKTNTKMSRDAN